MRRTFLIFFASLLSMSLWAYDFEADGIYYNIIGSNVLTGYTVEVTYGGQFSYSGTESYNVEELTIPATTTYERTPCQVVGIGNSAFYMCSAKKISLPEGITYIDEKAFYRSTSLEEVDISDGLVSIGESAFYLCSALDSIYLPSTVESLAFKCFGSCSSLETVVSLNVTPPSVPEDSEGSPFDNIASDCVLYVPGNAVEAYSEASVWKSFTIVGLPLYFECVTDPEDNAVIPKLENIYVYNPTEGEEIFPNPEIIEVPEVNVYDSDGNIVTKMSYIDTLEGGNEDDGWTQLAQVICFGGDGYPDEIIEDGTYYVTIPEDIFVIYDEDGYAYYSEAMTLTYIVSEDAVQEPTYTLIISPESGSQLDILSAISISCDEGISEVAIHDDIIITDADGNRYENVYTIEEYAAEGSQLVTEVVIRLNPEYVAEGTYYVYIPARIFDVGSSMMEESLLLEYYVTGDLDGIAGVRVDSENISGIYTLDGKRLNALQKGVNILQMSDNSTKKVLVK